MYPSINDHATTMLPLTLDNILLAKFDALRRYAAWLGIRVDDLKGDRALLRRRVLRHLSREHTLK